MINAAESTEAYRTLFTEFERSLEEGAGTWIHPFRRSALARFCELGFPKTTMEDWRFTNVAPIARSSFQLAGASPPQVPPDISGMLNKLSLGDWKRNQLVFLNGRYCRELSVVQPLPEGVVMRPLAEALGSHRELVEAHLARGADRLENAFTALNRAFLADGAFIYLPRNCRLEDPIHLLFLAGSAGSACSDRPAVMTHPHTLLVADTGSEAKIVESYGGSSGQVYLTNTVTEVVAGDNAVIDHYKLQREGRDGFHVASLEIRQGRAASVTSHSISLGGRLARHDINVVLGGDGGESTLNGLYAVGGAQHVDHHTVVDHAKPHCSSNELYKGILDDRARGVFNGRIIVRPDAQKTNAQQTNKNLLLSDAALVNTNPQLEINADDVKCAHGATIGQLDADALFYLRSRGIDREAARSLLIYGFMSDITNRIGIEAVRSALEKILVTNLPKGM